MNQPAYIEGDHWKRNVGKVASNYTLSEAARIIARRIEVIEDLVWREELTGPASTDTHPVDHEALRHYLGTRMHFWKHAKARQELVRALDEKLTTLGEPPTRRIR